MASDDRLVRESTDTYPFLDRVGGVLPGYSGHRPGEKNVCYKSTYGGVPRPSGAERNKSGQWEPRPQVLCTPGNGPGQGQHLGNNPTTQWMEVGIDWKEPAAPSANQRYLVQSGGVKMGYMGFVPHGKRHYGSSHKGGVDGTRPGLLEQRKVAQAPKEITESGNAWFGTLQLPGMIEDAKAAFVGSDASSIPMQPRGGAPLGYAGHRPMQINENSDHPLARMTPYRRHFREISGKVGTERPSSAPSARRQLPKHDGFTPHAFRPATQALGVNDWLVHQKAPPPGLPPDSATSHRASTAALEYVCDVGGVAAGYAGFVPHSAAHCGSSHVGMHGLVPKGGHSARAQRGHTGKVDGTILRVQAERNKMSRLAGGAAIGYSGHLPGASLGFGMSPWKPDEYEA